MSFDASSLTALVSAGSFSIWDYRTGDSRAAVLASGYFAAATDRLLPGHVVILHSADGMSFLPMREAGADIMMARRLGDWKKPNPAPHSAMRQQRSQTEGEAGISAIEARPSASSANPTPPRAPAA